MPKHPLAEIFGFPTDNLSLDAARYRKNKLCPFNNRVPSCTKDKIEDPLGVCSVYDNVQERLDEKLESGAAPDAPTLQDIIKNEEP